MTGSTKITMTKTMMTNSTIKGSDEFIVEEGVSRYGLHRLHVLSGQRIDAEKWLRGSVEAVYQYEDDAGMWHLRLYWRDGGGDGREI